MKAIREDARKLMHYGGLALSRVEENGIRIDADLLDRTILKVKRRIDDLSEKLKTSKEWTEWRRMFGSKMTLGSRPQLVKVLKEMGHEMSGGQTRRGHRQKADKVSLERLDIPFVHDYLEIAKLEKLHGTYLLGMRREVVDGLLHPFFNLHTVVTYRSCVAKGTPIEVVRDVLRQPLGVPIEDVQPGDYVYCYNDKKKLVLRRVLWAGRTGRRELVRVHWRARGKRGYVDLTPEHKVRLCDGRYVEARELTGDFRGPSASRHAPKIRVLSLGRAGDRICPTGVPDLHDHRFVYQQLVGSLDDTDVVHHRDGNHFNNVPANLEKMTLPEHSKQHCEETLTVGARKKAVLSRMRNHKKYGDRWLSGPDHYDWVDFGKFGLLRRLALSGGRVSKANFDFTSMKRRSEMFGVDLRAVKIRYDRNGDYISLGRLKRVLEVGGRSGIQREFGINFYKVKELLEQRGLSLDRRWANQFGPFVPNNHQVTRIERLDGEHDVYDIEVEGCHNFIAGGICVHNSSDRPNFQNIPIRDKLIGKLIRRCFVPRDGHVLVEVDFKQLEVAVGACYHRDPRMIEYLESGYDFHRSLAAELYMLEEDEVNAEVRYCAKNKFVFPEFYGSYFAQCAPSLWEAIDTMNLTTAIGRPLKEHLVEQGISDLGKAKSDWDTGRIETGESTFMDHVREVEQEFWGERFCVYAEWKEKWWQQYLKRGWFELLTGFREDGLYSRNDVINHPVQGAAFHCLLWTLTELVKWLSKSKMKSMVVGQIHDSMLCDVHRDELDCFLGKVQELATVRLQEAWRWIVVPLAVDVAIAEENWFEKRGLMG